MSGSEHEDGDRNPRPNGLFRRALVGSGVVILLVSASVLIAGALPSQNVAAHHHSTQTQDSAARSTTTTTPPTTTTTAPPPTTTAPPTTTPPAPSTTSAPATEAAAPQPSGYGCTAALAYLSANAAPGFSFECPGYADGHEAMTCVDHAPECPGEKLIAINDPCPAAYMNEAYNSNSWSDASQTFTRPIDPYGGC